MRAPSQTQHDQGRGCGLNGIQTGQGQSYTHSGQGGGCCGSWEAGLLQQSLGPFDTKGHIQTINSWYHQQT